jgi:hypothetical protein
MVRMSRDTLQLAIFLVAMIAAVIKLIQLARKPPATNRPAVTAMCAAIIAMAVALLQEKPMVTTVVMGTLGSEFGYAQRHTPALVSFFFLRVAFLCWVWPPGEHRRRRLMLHTWVIAGVLALRWLLAAAAPAGEAAAALRGYWSLAPWTAAAMLLYVFYLVFTIGSTTALALVWARTVAGRRRWTALGLRLIALGSAGYGLYLAHKLVFLLVQLALGYPPYDQVRAEWFLLYPSTSLLLLGLAVPLVATGLPAAVHLTRQRVAYGRLGPLWMALTGHQPEVVLCSRPQWVPAWAGAWWDRFSLRELGFRLYRRVIECWDVIVALHAHLDARRRDEVYQRALELGAGAAVARAIAEAVMIRTALEQVHQGAEPVPGEHRAQPLDRHPLLEDNVAWWQTVARAWGHPITASLSPLPARS